MAPPERGKGNYAKPQQSKRPRFRNSRSRWTSQGERIEQEGVDLSVESSSSHHIAEVINPKSLVQNPARIRRNKRIQVDHLATRKNEAMLGSIGEVAGTYDHS